MPDRDPPTDPGRKPRAERRETRLLARKVPLRFATVVLSMAYSVAAPHVGVPSETAMLVLGLAAAFLGVDTLRPSGTVRE